MSAALAAGIAATSALVGAGVNYWVQKKNQERTNRMNRENWQKENAYNTPAAQMARLRAAGLSPNLMYQNGAPAASGSIEAPQTGQNIADFSGVSDAYVSGVQAQNQSTQVDAYVSYLDSLKEKLGKESEGIGYDNMMKAAKSEFADRFAKYELRNMAHNSMLMEAQANLYDQQSKLVEEQTGITKQDRLTYGLRFMADMRKLADDHKISQATVNEINSRITKIAQDISESKFRQNLIEAQTKNEKQALRNMKAEFENLVTQNIRAEFAMQLESITTDWFKSSAGLDGRQGVSTQTHLDKTLMLTLDQLERDYYLSPLSAVGGLFRDIGIGVGGFMQLKGSPKRNSIGFNH